MKYPDNVILQVLEDHWEKEGYCPSSQEFQDLTGIHRLRVLNALHRLEDEGYIERFQHVRGWRVVHARDD